MSLYGTLNIGVSALQAQSNAIGIISDNIANVSTTGYKEGVASFSDLISDHSADNYSVNGSGSADDAYFPMGVLAGDTPLNTLQGIITSGNSPTDVAISGSGFFAVSQNTPASGNILYTRNGSFTQDANGNFVNSAGYYLQGWVLDAAGALPASLNTTSVESGTAIAALHTVNVTQLVEQPLATSTVSLQANLDASQAAYTSLPAYNPTDTSANMTSGAVSPQFSTTITVDDSTGAAHTITAGFLNTAPNTWAVELYAQPATDVTGTSGQIAAGTITFNGDGSLANVSSSLSQPVTVNWSNGAATGNVTFNWGTAGAIGTGKTDGLSQLAKSYAAQYQQNGIQPSTPTSISITSDGYVQGGYSDGTTRNLFKIPLADFTDPNELQSISGNVFATTVNTDAPNFLQVGQGGAGTLDTNSLESSNVDLSSQLTSIIIAQNSYQSCAKLISTSDTMLNDLVSMGAT